MSMAKRDDVVFFRAEITGLLGPIMLLARITDVKEYTLELELFAAERRSFWVSRNLVFPVQTFAIEESDESPRMMLARGVEGHLFHKHRKDSECYNASCVPFDPHIHIPGPTGTYTRRKDSIATSADS